MPTPTLYKFVASELHQRTPSEFVDDDGNLVFFDREHQIMPKILKFDDDMYDIMNHLFHGLELEHPEYDRHFKKAFLFRFINRQINRQTIEAFKFELMATFLASESYINLVYRDAEKFILQRSETEGTSKEISNEISEQISKQLTEQLDKRDTEDTARQESKESNANESKENSRGTNRQEVDGTTESDTATGRSDLPQNTVDLSLDNRNMRTANEFEKNRNKSSDKRNTDTTTTNETTGETSGESSGETSSEATGKQTGETTTDTTGMTDSERDATRDGETAGTSIQYRLDELFKSVGIMEGIFNTFDRRCFLQTW